MGFHKDLKGLDLHSPSNERVENNTGSTISKLKAIKFSGIGSGGSYPSALPISSYSDHVRGVMAEVVANNATGLACAFGILQNVDTSAWTVGTQIYSDDSGNLTSTVTAIRVGEVLKQHATAGIIYIESGIVGPAGPVVSFKQDGTTVIASPSALNVVAPLKITDAGGGQGNLKTYENHNVFGGIASVGGNATSLISFGVTAATSGAQMVKNGEIYAVSITLTNARTAGTCTAMSVIEGVAQNGAGQTAVIDGTSTLKKYQIISPPIQYNAGDVVTGQAVTSGFTPAGSNAVVKIWCRDRD